MKDTKNIHFETQKILGRKTILVHVYSSHDQTHLGVIKWFPRWRTYWFEPDADTGFTFDCMDDISACIKELMEERKNAKKSRT